MDNVFYAMFKLDSEGKPFYNNFFQSMSLIKMCGGKGDAYHRVEVRERKPDDPSQDYWGWLDDPKHSPRKTPAYAMICRGKIVFDIQFPYSPEAEVKAGKGRIVELIVEMVEDCGVL